MALPKLRVTVPQDGYSFSEGDGVLRAAVSSGPSRMRLDVEDAAMMGQISLVLEPDEYNYWRAFYRTSIRKGSLPFLIDVVVDSTDIEEYRVQIIPGSIRTSIQGSAYIVGMDLEVQSSDTLPSADTDGAIVMLYDLYGSESGLFLNRLEQLANYQLPRVE